MHLGNTIFPGWYYLYDLRKNPDDILQLDREGLQQSLFESPKWLRTLKSNRAPLIMDSEMALLDESYKILGMSELKKRYNLLKKHKDELSSRIRDIVEEQYSDKQEFNQEELQPEEKIYSLNPSNEERNLMTQFNQDNTTANCNKMYDDLIDLIEKDCQTNLEGTGLENIPADTVRAWKNLCFIYDVIGG